MRVILIFFILFLLGVEKNYSESMKLEIAFKKTNFKNNILTIKIKNISKKDVQLYHFSHDFISFNSPSIDSLTSGIFIEVIDENNTIISKRPNTLHERDIC